MKLMIFESGYDGHDDEQLLVIDNIDILPNKGDEIVVHDRHYIVESFLWHTGDENVCVTMFVVTDTIITVYDANRIVGSVKLEGQLDSLIIADNE